MFCNDNDIIIAFRISRFLFSGVSIMISDYIFYGAKPKARYTAFSEACDYASSHRSPSIVLLPPESANINQESDTEDAPEHFTNDGALFEPALELKVEDRNCSVIMTVEVKLKFLPLRDKRPVLHYGKK